MFYSVQQWHQWATVVLGAYPIHGSFNRVQFNYYFLPLIERDSFLVMDNASIHNERELYGGPLVPLLHTVKQIEQQVANLEKSISLILSGLEE